MVYSAHMIQSLDIMQQTRCALDYIICIGARVYIVSTMCVLKYIGLHHGGEQYIELRKTNWSLSHRHVIYFSEDSTPDQHDVHLCCRYYTTICFNVCGSSSGSRDVF